MTRGRCVRRRAVLPGSTESAQQRFCAKLSEGVSAARSHDERSTRRRHASECRYTVHDGSAGRSEASRDAPVLRESPQGRATHTFRMGGRRRVAECRFRRLTWITSSTYFPGDASTSYEEPAVLPGLAIAELSTTAPRVTARATRPLGRPFPRRRMSVLPGRHDRRTAASAHRRMACRTAGDVVVDADIRSCALSTTRAASQRRTDRSTDTACSDRTESSSDVARLRERLPDPSIPLSRRDSSGGPVR